jgi:hypothetical protein
LIFLVENKIGHGMAGNFQAHIAVAVRLCERRVSETEERRRNPEQR